MTKGTTLLFVVFLEAEYLIFCFHCVKVTPDLERNLAQPAFKWASVPHLYAPQGVVPQDQQQSIPNAFPGRGVQAGKSLLQPGGVVLPPPGVAKVFCLSPHQKPAVS